MTLAHKIALIVSAVITLGAVAISVLVPQSISVEFEQFVEAEQNLESTDQRTESLLADLGEQYSAIGRPALSMNAFSLPGDQQLVVLFDDGNAYWHQTNIEGSVRFDESADRLAITILGDDENRIVLNGLSPLLLSGPNDSARAWLLPKAILSPVDPPAISFAESVRSRTYWIVAPTILLVLVVVFVVVQRTTRPIRRLRDALGMIDDGPLPASLPVDRRDEIGELTAGFNETLARLARMRSGRRRMTSDLAHELRTPLTNIRSRLEGMADGLFDRSDEQIELVLGELSLLTRLVDDFQQLSLAEANELKVELRPVDVQPLLEAVVTSWQPAAADQESTITLACEASNQALADPVRLRQLLNVLLDNALRHGGPGVAVTLAVSHNNDSIAIDVVDNGPGIPAVERDQVFERLYRVDESRDRRTGGSGLGLAIARQLARLQGGQLVLLETLKGTGARFRIILHGAKERLKS